MEKFKQFDYFRKVQDDLKSEKSLIGGIIGFSTIFLVITLVFYETYQVFFGNYKTYPFINNYNPNEKVRVNLNITFEEIFCKALSIDYQDVSGAHLEDMHLTVHKLRLDQLGRFLDYDSVQGIKKDEQKFYPGSPFFEAVKTNNQVQSQFSNNVSCYGAELYEGQICLTCSDVLIAFAQRGWPQPMKEQISQCNEGTKENFKTVQMLDGEVKQSNSVNVFRPPPDQNNLIEILQRTNIVEQIMSQIDPRIYDVMDENDTQFFNQILAELNEIQFNPEENSQMQQNYEITSRVQQIQILLSKYYSELQAIKPKEISLQTSADYLNISEMPTEKRVLFQMQISRPICNESIVYKVRLSSNLNQIQNSAQASEFLKNEGLQTMNERECIHVFPIFIEKSPFNAMSIILSIPDFDVQQQYIFEEKNWNITLELIKDSTTQKFVSQNNKKTIHIQYIPQNLNQQINQSQQKQRQQDNVQNQQNQEESQSNGTQEQQQDKQQNSSQQEEANENGQGKKRVLFQQNYGHETITGDKVFSQETLNEMQQQLNQREKCQIYGHFYVKKVPGNFHVSFHNEGLLLMHSNLIFNLRHTIHTLEFTTEDGSLTLGKYTKSSNPLDKTVHNPGHGMDTDYYLKVVNTVFENMLSEHNNIYSFTSLETSGVRDFRLPSVNFRYEFDPITVLHYRKSRSFTQFIVTLCAIVGGSIAISKYIYTLLVK
ncbi:hypothetical protein ABPG74_020195 [Tetrahymena malaccensis]